MKQITVLRGKANAYIVKVKIALGRYLSRQLLILRRRYEVILKGRRTFYLLLYKRMNSRYHREYVLRLRKYRRMLVVFYNKKITQLHIMVRTRITVETRRVIKIYMTRALHYRTRKSREIWKHVHVLIL
jgi:hypothetical protein